MTNKQRIEIGSFIREARYCDYSEIKVGMLSYVNPNLHLVNIVYTSKSSEGKRLYRLVGEYSRLSSATKLMKEIQEVLSEAGLN